MLYILNKFSSYAQYFYLKIKRNIFIKGYNNIFFYHLNPYFITFCKSFILDKKGKFYFCLRLYIYYMS
ncbi:hypothetical protein PFAG_05805 [Plasmodium falciparum Santa Lucia]|uniref:Uncharacterized protein n=1 Tax=Plasmodium falciparum Santa Lucia TaxID=478859 RepID=W7FN38_PLAFA|nr:hypothetical protein PFAG_05805 [Plasmodium falciparum Santa Lucia]